MSGCDIHLAGMLGAAPVDAGGLFAGTPIVEVVLLGIGMVLTIGLAVFFIVTIRSHTKEHDESAEEGSDH